MTNRCHFSVVVALSPAAAAAATTAFAHPSKNLQYNSRAKTSFEAFYLHRYWIENLKKDEF
jgi:hypothetical protein